MPFDKTTAGRVRTALGRSKEITEKKMFGGLAFMYQGNMVCGVLKDQLVLRLGNEGAAAALKQEHVSPMDFTGTPIKSMVYLAPAGFATNRQLENWIDRAVEFAKDLPPK